MTKPAAFILNDLPKHKVVNRNYCSIEQKFTENIINQAISEHFETIEEGEGALLDYSSSIVEDATNESLAADQLPAAEIEPQLYTEADVVKMQEEAVAEAVDKVKEEFEAKISEMNQHQELNKMLLEKLESFLPESNIEKQIIAICSDITSQIADKLHLVLPSDFNSILRKHLLKQLKKSYKSGKIILSLHPNNYSFCIEVLTSEEEFAKLQDNIEVVQDPDLDLSDCKIEWQDTKLEYNRKQLSSEVQKIVEQLNATTQEV